MLAGEFDELALFRAIEDSHARALLIGRRAMVVLGLPVLTADYDFWIAIDDIEKFNAAAARLDLHPTKSPEEARRTGRYVLENDETVDVLIARSVTAKTGELVAFEDLWTRRRRIALGEGVSAVLPSLADLILTKHFALRPKDVEDVRMLRTLEDREP